MKKKAAIELSMNFFVIIIISLVIFAFGIRFIYTMFDESNKLEKMTMEDIDRQISSLMCANNEKVCIEGDTINLRAGKFEVLTVKILNIGAQGESDFNLEVTKGKYISLSNEEGTEEDNNIIIFPETRSGTIKNNNAEYFGFGFEAPKKDIKKGTYIFDLNIKRDGQQYDKVHKIYVKVK